MKFTSDIDIDFADREQILQHLDYTSAMMIVDDKPRRHNTGIYATDIPYDPRYNLSAIEYQTAEQRGYVKLDFLNVNLYRYVTSEIHLIELMSEPDWSMLENETVFRQLIHISGHWDTAKKLSEPINTIPRMAMFLSLIRPGKRHLIGKTWQEISQTIWDRTDDSYSFKQAHAVSYAHLVVVHMNLIATGIIVPDVLE
jgi:hypothetical protein